MFVSVIMQVSILTKRGVLVRGVGVVFQLLSGHITAKRKKGTRNERSIQLNYPDTQAQG